MTVNLILRDGRFYPATRVDSQLAVHCGANTDADGLLRHREASFNANVKPVMLAHGWVISTIKQQGSTPPES